MRTPSHTVWFAEGRQDELSRRDILNLPPEGMPTHLHKCVNPNRSCDQSDNDALLLKSLFFLFPLESYEETEH